MLRRKQDQRKVARAVEKMRCAVGLLNEVYVDADEPQCRSVALTVLQAMQPLRGMSEGLVPSPPKTLFSRVG